MIYIKSAIAGFAAVIAIALVAFAIGIFILIFLSFRARTQDSGIGWDFVAFARSSSVAFIALLTFIAGFIWEYRRLSH
jgi:hypothetical protein